MSAERWSELRALYDRMVEASPSSRERLLEEVGTRDPDMRAELAALLAADNAPATFLELPVARLTQSRLNSGQRLGAYEVIAPIGAGGMGEVYRARDTKLYRDVALKVISPAFAHDLDRLARFEREAQVLAALNHPNIAAIFGLEDANGVKALALEFVDGPTLADRIAESPIPVEETLSIARQIAEALEAAHEAGIIHRDLKPANIKVRPDGTVKVLDFGLAKLGETTAAGNPALSHSPTMTPEMSGTGVILGTAAYMAPEQARGKAVDKRADIWAFGCVLYEMLTGHAPFEGDDVSDTLANVLKREPDWNALFDDVPKTIRSLLKRCLEKDARRRAADVAVAIFAIDEAATLEGPAAVARPAGILLLWRVGIPVLAVAIGAGAIGAVAYFRFTPPVAPEMRLQIVTPPAGYDAGAVSFGISPDGQNIVFVAAPDQTPRLWIRPLASEIARPIAGTERGSLPFWSPDGRTIGFFADQKLKRVDIAGGTPQTLADAPRPYGATWNSDGMILFSGLNTSPLYRVPAIGGQRPVAATRLDTTRQVSHRFPHFLPDGRRFLFFATGSSDVQGVYIGSLDSEETRRLVSASTAAVFVSPDYLLFGRGEALYAQRLETQSMEPVGDPRLVAERVARDSLTFASVALAASSAGTFAYRTPAESARELVWLDRAGKQIGSLGRPEGLTPSVPRLSPDGGSVIVQRTVDGNTDIWVIDTTRGVLKRLTFDPAADSARAWSPDGLRVLVGSARKKGGGVNDLYVTSLSGTSDKLLLESAENKNGFDWSRDGRFIVYTSDSPTTAGDIWTLPLDGDRRPFAVVRTNSQETSPQISRDGNWIAYHSTETGRYEVFVQAFPAPGRNWQISTAGGGVARWRADGRELFYIALDARLMAVPISVNPHGSTVEAGTPVPLFSVRVGSDYDVTPDGQRFLINTPTGESSTTPITVVLNWSGLNR